ncbi:4-coumarate--CoA ligase 1-like [Culex quinquefasciatus]|uniref:4-coumarate--CoA ligase 1-like n=1 Tax=Culex quinquefasciatus TaxID=7176 RepID=UPI0018E375F8|nr:4-coumarate--CoA ligase 1-like [Culex quinquefasciatus]
MAAPTEEQYVFYGGSTDESVENGCRSLGELILKRMRTNGDDVAFIDGITGHETTFADMLEQSVRLANRFHRIGIKKNYVVAIMCENRIELALVSLATIYLNAIPILLNPSYTPTELEHVLKLAKPRAIFVSPIALKTLLTVAPAIPSLKMITLLGSKEKPNSKITLFSELFDRNKLKSARAFTPQPVNLREQVALMVLSSGTTGLPKAVQLTHYNIMSVMAYIRQDAKTFGLPANSRVLGLLPFFHIYGYMMVLSSFCNGRTMVSLPKFEPDLFLCTIQKYEIMGAALVPPLMVFLAKHPLVDKYDLSCLRAISCGAAPLSKEIEEMVLKRLPNLLMIRTGYGMSECSLGALTRNSDKAGSVGQVNRMFWIKIVDTESGKTLGPHQVGEICVKGPMVMKGYLDNEKETRSIIDRDGWLHTGDTGYFDEDHDFYIVDRIKDLIKYKGFQVAPAEVEAVLLTNAKIKDVAVIGLPDEASGEVPIAFVVTQPDAQLSDAEVKAWVADRLSRQKHLHGGVRFVAEIPKTASGKILKRELRKLVTKAKL